MLCCPTHISTTPLHLSACFWKKLRIILAFSLIHVPSTNTEEVWSMIYQVASHQMIWVYFWGSVSQENEEKATCFLSCGVWYAIFQCHRNTAVWWYCFVAVSDLFTVCIFLVFIGSKDPAVIFTHAPLDTNGFILSFTQEPTGSTWSSVPCCQNLLASITPPLFLLVNFYTTVLLCRSKVVCRCRPRHWITLHVIAIFILLCAFLYIQERIPLLALTRWGETVSLSWLKSLLGIPSRPSLM